MSHLSLAVLGSPVLHVAGKAVTPPTRKAMALLVYLAVEGNLHPRDKLAALFWPESAPGAARATLRSTLAGLRRATSFVQGGKHCLVVERDALGFDLAASCDLDFRVLKEAAALARQPVPPQERRRALAQLAGSAPRYRGDFLEGFSLRDAPDFDDWMSVQREYWHRQMQVVFDALTQLQADTGEIEKAVESASRWVALDALNEQAYQRLVRLHLAAGHREAAMRAYRACREMLEREFGVEPAPETEALVERLRQEHLAPPATGSPERARTPAGPPPLTIPMVGRATEFAIMVESYHAARQGLHRVLVIEGEGGIGKTRLATEFLGWAQAQGAIILQGRAIETHARVPYHPLVEALRRVHGWEELDISPHWLTELSRLLPELQERFPGLPTPVADAVDAGTRLFEAIARVGEALAPSAPLILFLDDVHWADHATLAALHYAARRWAERGVPVCLLLTLRDGAEMGAARGWVASMEREPGLTRLSLGPLAEEETLRLVTALDPEPEPGHATAEHLGPWLHAESGGHPFYIVETVRSLLDQEVLAWHARPGGRWAIELTGTAGAAVGDALPGPVLPRGVREMVRARLSPLGTAGRALLAAGAVLGHGFTFDHARRVAGFDERDALLALDEIITNRLIQESPEPATSTEAGYSFLHDKISAVVYEDAGEARRSIFHRRAFEVLQDACAPAASLAYHALAGRLVEPAFSFSVTAGDEALRLFALRDAIDHFQQALQITRHWDDAPAAALHHLYAQLGRSYELDGDYQRASYLYEEMRAAGRAGLGATTECTALNRLALLVAHESKQLERATELLEQAAAIATTAGDRVAQAETEWNRALLAVYAGDEPVSRAHAEQALQLAQEVGQQALIERGLESIAFAMLDLGTGDAPAPLVESTCTCCLVPNARLNCTQPREGIATTRAVLTVNLQVDNTWGEVNSAISLAWGLLDVGDYEEALRVGDHALQSVRAASLTPLLFPALTALGAVHQALYQLDRARALHLEAQAINDALPSRPYTELVAAELCADHALASNWKAAYSYARQALAVRDYGSLLYPARLRLYETEALLRGGDEGLVAEDLRRFGTMTNHNQRYRVAYLRAHAVLARWRGDIEGALADLRAAATLAADLELPGEVWQIAAETRALHTARGDTISASKAHKHVLRALQSISDRIMDPTLRASFLATALSTTTRSQRPRGPST